MEIFRYKDSNIVGYNEETKEIIFRPKTNSYDEVKEYKYKDEVWGRHIYYEVLLLRYFIGKTFYYKSGREIEIPGGDKTTYAVFKLTDIEDYLSKIKINSDILKETIYVEDYISVDTFRPSYISQVNVESVDNTITRVKIEFLGYTFIDSVPNTFDSEKDLIEYIRYAFWGTAKLNGELIKLN